MGEENGNGMRPVDIDVTDEHAFKTGVVQYLQLISDRTSCLPEVKRKVEYHERIVQASKWASVPLLAVLHFGLKHLLHLLSKLGW